MENRLSVATTSPAIYKAMHGVAGAIRASSLPARLHHLIDLRVSQINGCAYCIDLHSTEARHGGETEERIAALAAWEDSSLFEPAERASLAWAEALTRNRHDRIDETHEELQRHLDATRIGDLTMAVAAINAWNRIGIAQHRAAPPRHEAA